MLQLKACHFSRQEVAVYHTERKPDFVLRYVFLKLLDLVLQQDFSLKALLVARFFSQHATGSVAKMLYLLVLTSFTLLLALLHLLPEAIEQQPLIWTTILMHRMYSLAPWSRLRHIVWRGKWEMHCLRTAAPASVLADNRRESGTADNDT